MKKHLIQRLVLFFIIVSFFYSISAQVLTVREIMKEPSIAGMRPEAEEISPDGKWVIFSWNERQKQPRNLYIASTKGGSPELLIDAASIYDPPQSTADSRLNYGLNSRDDFIKDREKNLSSARFSPDSKQIAFVQNGDIYLLNLETRKLKRITRTQNPEAQLRWLTNTKILFSNGANFFVFDVEEPSLTQLTKEGNPTTFQNITLNAASKDGRNFAYVVSDGSKQRTLLVPDYLDEFVQTKTVRRGWSDQKIFVTKIDSSSNKPYEIKLPKPDGNYYIRSIKWASDNQSLIIDRVDADTKRRIIFLVKGIATGEEKVINITQETDEKWIAPLSRLIEPHPTDANQILFASERDGFNHLYLAKLDGNDKVQVTQLTRGNWEIDWVRWLDSSRIIYSSTEENPAQREFYILNLTDGSKVQLKTEDKGMKTNPQLSENSKVLLYSFSQWKTPTELYAIEICDTCKSVRLSNSIPTEFFNRKWSEPNFIDIPTRDAKFIKAKVYLPENFNKKQRYPMVIFVHGAGYLQNTINGWNNYYREFLFNQILTQKGYVVLDIDYRGSAGYGRDWRTDVHGFLGGKDYEDHLDAIEFMIKNYSVDAKRVGVYGGSYGGFMASMLVLRAPDKVACGAALRPVFDWKNYYASSPIYTTERLGYPEKNPEAYRRSSPIAYADKLQRPLLILHGLLDDNVHAQDSIQMIEKLIRLEKTQFFDAMLYPSENHVFLRDTSWADEYERILTFFEKCLK